MIIVVQQTGRLGNQLQLFAHCINCSLETGHRVINLAFHEYQEYFVGTSNDALSRFPSSRSPKLSGAARRALYRCARFLDRVGILRRLPGTVVLRAFEGELDLAVQPGIASRKTFFLAGGWAFRYWPGFERNLPEFRRFFSLVPQRAQRVSRFLEGIRTRSKILVGVHIRQTDFKSHRNGEYYFESVQYAFVMQQFCNLIPGETISFVVCSDAPQRAEDFPGLDVAFPDPEQVEDLFILSGCDYIIGPAISSYCILASMLGDKPRLGITDPAAHFTIDDFQVCTQ